MSGLACQVSACVPSAQEGGGGEGWKMEFVKGGEMVEEDRERTKGQRNTDKMVHQFRTHTVRTEGPTPSGIRFIQCVCASVCVCV